MSFELEHVTGQDKKTFCLRDINLSVPEGYLVGIAGKNGAGKTTLLRYIADRKKHYNGTIRLDGEELHGMNGQMQTRMFNQIAYIADEVHFFGMYSMRQNARLLATVYDAWDSEVFEQAIHDMGLVSGNPLSLDRSLSQLSRGEYIKFQMAVAMAHHAKLYLLDEVTGGMDPIFRKDFFRLLHRIVATEEAVVLMTTHIEEELEEKMDYVGVMENGRLIRFSEVAG